MARPQGHVRRMQNSIARQKYLAEHEEARNLLRRHQNQPLDIQKINHDENDMTKSFVDDEGIVWTPVGSDKDPFFY